jgi:IS5 family transposase
VATRVLRLVLVKQMNGFSYEELAFHVADSVTYRSFSGYGALEPTPSRSTIAENIKKVRPTTLEKINRRLVRYAVVLGIEKGRRVRVDATVTETNIHTPSDSAQLFDGVRVLTRLLGEAQVLCGFEQWSDHTKRAKRRMLEIHNTGAASKPRSAYTDLLKLTERAIAYTIAPLDALRDVRGRRRRKALALASEIAAVLPWIQAVIDQRSGACCRRRASPPRRRSCRSSSRTRTSL